MKTFKEDLKKLTAMKAAVSHLNPALENFYPVAIVIEDCFHVYDFSTERRVYEFEKHFPGPMPVPDGVRAAFQLEAYGGRIACVVTPDVFDTQSGYVTLLHEFVHCYQYETCEQKLKMTLDIARKAQDRGDCMWEIEYPFPYTAEDFIRPYTDFLEGLAQGNQVQIDSARFSLHSYLGLHDYEYMVWQEWKEGFARWVENRVRSFLGLQNKAGSIQRPYSRVLFYAGGQAYIDYLAQNCPELTSDLPGLFHCMLSVPSEERSS